MMSGLDVRPAVAADREAFMRLVEEYLRELAEVGSETLVTPKTLEFWAHLFDLYVLEAGPGVILMAGDVAFTACGSFGPAPTDTVWGEAAYGWGTYVRREYRRHALAANLRGAAKTALRAKGFDALLGCVHFKNEAGLASAMKSGFRPYGISGYVLLGE